jgi:hypothetical protein
VKLMPNGGSQLPMVIDTAPCVSVRHSSTASQNSTAATTAAASSH